MKIKTLEDAVYDEMIVFIEQSKPFSAYDVTIALRTNIDNKKYAVTNNANIHTGYPYPFYHEHVKNAVYNHAKSALVNELSITNNGQYNVFTPHTSSNTTQQVAQPAKSQSQSMLWYAIKAYISNMRVRGCSERSLKHLQGSIKGNTIADIYNTLIANNVPVYGTGALSYQYIKAKDSKL